MTISRKVHFKLGKNTANKICRGELHEVKRKITRSAELMAFAIIFDGWLESGKVAGYSEIAQITGDFSSRSFKNYELSPKVSTLAGRCNFRENS